MPEGRRSIAVAEALQMSGGTIRPRGNIFHHLSFQDSGHQQLSEHKNLAAKVQDGDIIRVSRGQNIQLGAVYVSGHVQVRGRRSLAATSSVAKLLGDASSLKQNPYLLFGALETTDPKTRARRLFPVNLQRILQGTEDYALRDGDRLIVLGGKDIEYLSSSNIQDVVSRRIDAELRQQEMHDKSPNSDEGEEQAVQALDNRLSAIQTALASSSAPQQQNADVKTTQASVAESLEQSLLRECAGMRQLLAIVSVNSANRFANAVRTIHTVGMAQVNRQVCPQIFDDHGACYPSHWSMWWR